MQETRALEDQINSSDFEIPGYKRFMNVAEKKDTVVLQYILNMNHLKLKHVFLNQFLKKKAGSYH